MINVDNNAEGQQLTNDLTEVPKEKALEILKSLQSVTNALIDGNLPLPASISIARALSFLQFAFIGQLRSDLDFIMKSYPDNCPSLQVLRTIRDGNAPVDRDVSKAMAAEIIYLRMLNGRDEG